MMDELKISGIINSATYELNRISKKALRLKVLFMCMIVFSSVYGFMYVFPKFSRLGFSLTEIVLLFIGLCLILLIVAQFTSRYTYIPQNQVERFKYLLKKQLIESLFEENASGFKLYPDTFLPEDLLSKIGVISSSYPFITGGDLMVGEVHDYQVKFSEFYVQGFLNPKFCGFVAIIFDYNYDTEFELNRMTDKKKIQNNRGLNSPIPICLELFEKHESIQFVRATNNNLYIGLNGNREMLEFNFRKFNKNLPKLKSDLHVLELLLSIIHRITKPEDNNPSSRQTTTSSKAMLVN
jgi:hypothetical protein